MLDQRGIIVAVADAFVQIEFHIHILSGDHLAVHDFCCAALSSEGTEDRDRTEIIEVMIDRTDPEGNPWM